jgi:hypothetical protein
VNDHHDDAYDDDETGSSARFLLFCLLHAVSMWLFVGVSVAFLHRAMAQELTPAFNRRHGGMVRTLLLT